MMLLPMINKPRSYFHTTMILGCVAVLIVQMGLNIFGSCNLIPFTGVTIPFISQGGSSMITSGFLAGMLKAGQSPVFKKPEPKKKKPEQERRWLRHEKHSKYPTRRTADHSDFDCVFPRHGCFGLESSKRIFLYMSHSDDVTLGMVYDRNNQILFDPNASTETYDENYFLDVGNVIGDDSGQMTNTLVSENIEKLQNYSLILVQRLTEKRQFTPHWIIKPTKRYTMLLAAKTERQSLTTIRQERFWCASANSVNILDNYSNISELPDGSLICKAFYETTPGSTQKLQPLLRLWKHSVMMD